MSFVPVTKLRLRWPFIYQKGPLILIPGPLTIKG